MNEIDSDALPTAPVEALQTAPNATDAPSLAECQNCSAPLLGPFCHQCGQAVRSPVREFFALLGDGTSQLVRPDGKLLQTLKTLYFRPGALVNRYLAGQRMQFVKPLKLYLSLSLLLFLLVKTSAAIDTALSPPETPVTQTAAVKPEPVAKPATSNTANEKPSPRNPDEFEASVSDEGVNLTVKGKPWHPKTNPAGIDWLPEWFNRWFNRKLEHIDTASKQTSKDPSKLFDAMLAVLPTTMFMLVPIFALLLKILYFFKRRLYAEHLLASVQAHSFMFMSLIFITLLDIVGSLLPALSDLTSWVQAGIAIWSALYLFLLQKRVYGQHFIVTIFKFGVAAFCYLFLLSMGLAATAIGALANL
jgi:hypothetical protein